MMRLSTSIATQADAAELFDLQRRVSEDLTRRFGKGRWSPYGTEKGVIGRIQRATVLVVRRGRRMAGTLTLQTKKPWAIDRAYFTPVAACLYLVNMAVVPELQGRGVGRRLLAEADRAASQRGGRAIRLDAFDSEAGAGAFYASCGYREVGRKVYRAVPLVYFERLL